MVTLEQYKEAAAAARRPELYASVAKLVVLLVGVYGVPLGLMYLLSPYSDALVEAGAQWIVRHDLGPEQTKLIGLLSALLVTLPVALVLGIPVIGLWRLLDRGRRQDRRLFCPHCDARLGWLVVVTGNCQRCGARALRMPEGGPATAVPGEPDHHLLTVDEFNAAVRNRLRLRDPEHRDPRLRCPRCQADLAGGRFQVVTTRKCPRCEAPVLEDPDNTPPAGGPQPEQPRPSVAVFRTGSEAYRRWCLFGGMSLACLAFAPLFLVLCGETPLQRLLGETGVAVLAFAALLLGACLAFRVSWLAERRLRRRLYLGCPHCGQSLYHPSGVALATRRCYHCGRRALAEEEQPAPA
jgi:hypothetical protein